MKAALSAGPLNTVMDAHEQRCRIALSLVEFLTPWHKISLLNTLGSAAAILDQPLPELYRLLGRRLSTRQWRPQELVESAEGIQDRLTRDGAVSIFYGDRRYPALLSHIADPPLVLFVRGSLPDDGTLCAGVVGTRYPTGACRQAAFRLGFELGSSGVTVVSGLARGIDREAHEGCEQAGGRSVAVLGNGIDLIYPSSSRSTAHALLARGGAMVSEYPPGVPPLRWHFPARNRIISGLCRGVVVVQAPERSGALFTAEYAADQSRDLWVHATGVQGSTGAGTRWLAQNGAGVLRSAQPILREWGIEAATGMTTNQPIPGAI